MPAIDSPAAIRCRIAVDDTSAVEAVIKKINGDGYPPDPRLAPASSTVLIRDAIAGSRRANASTGDPGRETTAKWDCSRSAG